MLVLISKLFNDDAGFVVSSELILITTITVLGMVVGLSAVSNGINHELEDMGNSFASVNQNDRYAGLDGGMTVVQPHGEN